MGLDKKGENEIIFPEIRKSMRVIRFSDKRERDSPVTAVSTSLVLHTLVAAYLILFLQGAPITPFSHTTMQFISVSLDEEAPLAPPAQPVYFSPPGKTDWHKNTPGALPSDDSIDVRTKNDEMALSPLMEENTNATHTSEIAYTISSGITPYPIAYKNPLEGNKDHQNLTKKSDSSVQIMPRYLKTPKPPYPSSARIQGHHGVVLLRVEVLKSGCVGHISITKSSGYDILDKAALDTVTQWQFEPGRNKGGIQDMVIDIPVRFSLNN